jgi:hypothetical protein
MANEHGWMEQDLRLSSKSRHRGRYNLHVFFGGPSKLDKTCEIYTLCVRQQNPSLNVTYRYILEPGVTFVS